MVSWNFLENSCPTSAPLYFGLVGGRGGGIPRLPEGDPLGEGEV
tara:strand:- start:734 stop:865 length:132 start_codon:yes stop_codon:yes gene_type:complete